MERTKWTKRYLILIVAVLMMTMYVASTIASETNPLPAITSLSQDIYDYNGTERKPTVTIPGLTEGEDFDVTYADNTKAGTATAIATAKAGGNYTGTSEKTFTINKVALPAINPIDPQTYQPGGNTPAITYSGTLPVTADDVIISYSNNTGVTSTAQVTATAKADGNYTGEESQTFQITEATLPAITSLSPDTYVYTGDANEPTVKITGLIEGVDFTVTYADNTNAGTNAKAIATAKAGGNYTGTSEKTFTITAKTLPAITSLSPDTYVYTGDANEPTVKITGLTEGKDFDVTYADNIKAGTATAIATGKGNYKDTSEQTFTINPIALPAPQAILPQTYTSEQIKPVLLTDSYTGTLVEGKDYTAVYSNNINVSTSTTKASVTVTGKDNYKTDSTHTVTFTITARPLPEIVKPLPDMVHTGSYLKPDVTMNFGNDQPLVKDKDYTLSYKNNENVGTATVTATGKGNYTGTQTKEFQITPALLPSIAPLGDVPFDGKAYEPDVTMINPVTNLALVKDTDYTLTYLDNVKAGKAMILIDGIKNYAGGKKSHSFIITPIALPAPEAIADQVYTSEEIKPAPVLKDAATGTLEAGRDYTVVYADNIHVGQAIVTVTGKGNYKGDSVETVNFNIVAATLPAIKDINSLVFTGEALTPPVTMVYGQDKPLVVGRDYTLAYENNVHAGTATVTATGKGNYTGTQKKDFQITPALLPPIAPLEDVPFIGKAYEPDVTMINPVTKKALVKDTDYKLTYVNNIDAGQAIIMVEGINDYAGGKKTHPFNITPIDLPNIAEIPVQAYTGAAVEPGIIMTDDFTTGPLVKGRDFTVEYQNNIDGAMIKSAEAGEPTAIVTGINNYAGDTKSIKFVIADKSAPVFNWAGAKEHGASLEITVQDNWGLASVKVLHNGGATLNVSFADEQERVYEYRYNISFQLPGSYKVFATDLYGHTVNLFNTSGKEEETETAYQYYADSDKDGLSDAYEVSVSRTDPKNPDSDGDGLTDGDEVLLHRTDPLSQDTDGDGLTDSEELKMAQYGFSPREHDSDKDGISDTVAASVMDRYPVWEYNSTLALELLLRPNRTGLKPALSASQVTKALENMVTYNLLTGLINPYDAQVDKGTVMFKPALGEGRSTRAKISNTETLMVSLNPQGKQLGIHRQMLAVYDKDETGATIPVQVLDLERHQNADGTPALTYSDEAQKGKDSLVVMSDANGMLLLAGNWDAAEQKTMDDLILIDVADLKAYKVPNSAGATRFDVAPDASKAAYLLGGKVYVIDLASTDIKVLENKASLLDFTSNGDLIINLSGSKATVVDLEGNETRVDFDGVVNVKQPTNNYRSVILVKDGVQIAFSFAASANIRVTGQVWLRAEEVAPNVEATMPAFNSERLHDGKIARGLKISRTHMKGLIP